MVSAFHFESLPIGDNNEDRALPNLFYAPDHTGAGYSAADGFDVRCSDVKIALSRWPYELAWRRSRGDRGSRQSVRSTAR